MWGKNHVHSLVCFLLCFYCSHLYPLICWSCSFQSWELISNAVNILHILQISMVKKTKLLLSYCSFSTAAKLHLIILWNDNNFGLKVRIGPIVKNIWRNCTWSIKLYLAEKMNLMKEIWLSNSLSKLTNLLQSSFLTRLVCFNLLSLYNQFPRSLRAGYFKRPAAQWHQLVNCNKLSTRTNTRF